jgi:transcriptional regulator with XRE-family HTH domain
MNSEHYYPDKVAKARRLIGTQKVVASLLSITTNQLSRAENGKSASYELLSEIAARSDSDVRDFLKPTKKDLINLTSNVKSA